MKEKNIETMLFWVQLICGAILLVTLEITIIEMIIFG